MFPQLEHRFADAPPPPPPALTPQPPPLPPPAVFCAAGSKSRPGRAAFSSPPLGRSLATCGFPRRSGLFSASSSSCSLHASVDGAHFFDPLAPAIAHGGDAPPRKTHLISQLFTRVPRDVQQYARRPAVPVLVDLFVCIRALKATAGWQCTSGACLSMASTSVHVSDAQDLQQTSLTVLLSSSWMSLYRAISYKCGLLHINSAKMHQI